MKKAIYFIFALIILAIPSGVSQAQSADESKAKAYFFSAQEYFAAKDYVNALNYLQSAENLLGKGNARIEALRAKTLYHKGDFEAAKRSLDKFFGYSPSAKLTRDITGYTRDIEAKYEANKARIAAARSAKAEKERQDRIAADKRARAQAAAAEKKRQEEAERDIERQKVRTLVANILAPCVNVEKCQDAIGQNWADNLGLYSKATKESNPQRKQELTEQYANYLDKKWLLYWQRCQFGEIENCHQYANSLLETAKWIAENNSIKPRSKSLVAQLEVATGRNCTSSDLAVCVNQAFLRTLKSNCDRGYGKSCVPYTHNWESVVQLKFETRRTKLDILKKGCSGKSAVSCRNAFVDIFSKARRWSNESIQFAHKACNFGDSYSCLELAKDGRRGNRGINKNKSAAKTYYDKYCAIKKIDQKQCKTEYRKL